MGAGSTARQSWARFRRMPRRAQVATWVVVVVGALALIGSVQPDTAEVEATSPAPAVLAPAAGARADASTTSTTAPTTTSLPPTTTSTSAPAATVRPPATVTTTPPAPTTAPPVTAPPVTAPPVTTTTRPPAPTTTVAPTPTTAPAVAALGSSECDPNYSGCVPVDSDVDCSSGSGNGPAYARGPVRIVGRDVYGLDHDGDGVGCENG